MCNTICLIFLTAFTATRTQSASITTSASDTSQTLPPRPSTRTTPLPPSPHRCPLHDDIRDLNSFLDLSSEDSFQDSGLGLSAPFMEDVPSEDEEAGDTAQLINPLKVPATDLDAWCPFLSGDPLSPFRDQPTPSLSDSSFQLFGPGTPRTDHEEDEEYITLGVMTLRRGTARGGPAESHEDAIIDLTNRLAKLNLRSAPSKSATEAQPTTKRTKPPTAVGNVIRRPLGSVPTVHIIPKLANCCKLANSTSIPDSWEDHNFCYDCSTFRRFIRPMDEDSFFRSTRLAVDNLTHFRSSHYFLPNQPVCHHTLSDIFKPFGSIAERYFQSRLHDGVIVYESAFGVVDFSSEEEALSSFLALQGRRIRGEKAHWRLEFLDPEDMTFGDRLPTIHSKPPSELMRRLGVVAGEPERIDDSLCSSSPPVSARAFETLAKKKKRRAERLELYRPLTKFDEKRGGVGATLIFAVKANAKLAQV